jgi:hypothetical protein
MPCRSILSAAEREILLALPDAQEDLIRHYTFSESDLSLIRQRRGDANRLGCGAQLCYLRYPDFAFPCVSPRCLNLKPRCRGQPHHSSGERYNQGRIPPRTDLGHGSADRGPAHSFMSSGWSFRYCCTAASDHSSSLFKPMPRSTTLHGTRLLLSNLPKLSV